MRSIGLVLAVIGGFIMYLAFWGKVPAAWYAIRSGEMMPEKTTDPDTAKSPETETTPAPTDTVVV